MAADAGRYSETLRSVCEWLGVMFEMCYFEFLVDMFLGKWGIHTCSGGSAEARKIRYVVDSS